MDTQRVGVWVWDCRVKISVSFLLLLLVIAVAGGASYHYAGPVPGDVKATLFLQDRLTDFTDYADQITSAAKRPLLWGTIVVASIMVILASHWRMFLTPVLAWALAWFADKALRAKIFVPKPDDSLVNVATISTASGLPSTFGLVFGAVFGCVIFAAQRPFTGFIMQLLAWLAIIAGAVSRIVLGGHWSSQMVASIAAGMVLAMIVTRAMQIMVGKR